MNLTFLNVPVWLFGVLLLVGCGGGVTPTPPKGFSAQLESSSVRPMGFVTIALTNRTEGSSYEVELDLGGGNGSSFHHPSHPHGLIPMTSPPREFVVLAETRELPEPPREFVVLAETRELPDGRLRIVAPPGLLDEQELFTAGTVGITVVEHQQNGETARSDRLQLAVEALDESQLPPGELTLRALDAIRDVALEANANFGLLEIASDSELDVNDSVQQVNLMLERIGELESAIFSLIDGNEIPLGSMNGIDSTLTPGSLEILDRLFLGMFAALSNANGPGSADQIPLERDLTTSASFRKKSQRTPATQPTNSTESWAWPPA